MWDICSINEEGGSTIHKLNDPNNVKIGQGFTYHARKVEGKQRAVVCPRTGTHQITYSLLARPRTLLIQDHGTVVYEPHDGNAYIVEEMNTEEGVPNLCHRDVEIKECVQRREKDFAVER
ncbi:hypothetical protein JHK82_048994 [Glycine max]|nr:hypothetical protein JHK85_049601 [Glycine max]KAG5090216.1 hypothetical protein JHK82_048994 [Glycine max]KAG5093292.1 hypothetical protein JHK84_048880 [Glycine max]